MRSSALLLVPLALVFLWPAAARAAEPLAHTYSIVARDPKTGDFGVAVQSHWFQVGPIVPWAEAGVGAVATQSFVKVDYGPRGLALMRAGKSAEQALQELLAADPQKDVRQVAMVDAKGRVAVWTGPRCIAAAGHQQGAGYSVQANLMDKPTVWGAMARAYEGARGDLAERLLAALGAAEAEGGDIRGRQSAALIVVRATSTGEPWRDRLVDLRVDDYPQPLAELRRLLNLHRAYEEMNLGDEAFAAGKVEEALGHYTRGTKLAPEIAELPFWQAVTLFAAGQEEQALPIFREVFAREERWARLVPRLPAAGLLPDDPKKIERIQSLAPTRSGADRGNKRGTGKDKAAAQATEGTETRRLSLLPFSSDFLGGLLIGALTLPIRTRWRGVRALQRALRAVEEGILTTEYCLGTHTGDDEVRRQFERLNSDLEALRAVLIDHPRFGDKFWVAQRQAVELSLSRQNFQNLFLQEVFLGIRTLRQQPAWRLFLWAS